VPNPGEPGRTERTRDHRQLSGSRGLRSSGASKLGARGIEAWALRLLGEIASAEDRFDAAGAHFGQALALAAPRGMRPLVAHCHLGLAKLYQRTDKRQEAREHLRHAMRMYREMDMRFYLEQAEAESRGLA
jgi:tetratricopeptide (TPR) repeat protein